MKKLERVWKGVKSWTHKYLGGLFMEEKENGKNVVSLGRAAMFVVIVMFCWVWRRSVIGGETGVELPDGMLEVFYVLAGYVFGSKITGVLKTKKTTVSLGKDLEGK